MAKAGKRFRGAAEKIDAEKRYAMDDAIGVLIDAGGAAKFDETVELAVKLGVDPRQGHHRNSRLGWAAAGDLIALHAVLDVLEDEGEPALLWVLLGEMPSGQRSAPIDPVTELAVEGDLAQVRSQVDPDVAAVLVGGRELDDHALSLAP